MISFAAGVVVGVLLIPSCYRAWDWYDETVLDWWYNRKR